MTCNDASAGPDVILALVVETNVGASTKLTQVKGQYQVPFDLASTRFGCPDVIHVAFVADINADSSCLVEGGDKRQGHDVLFRLLLRGMIACPRS